MEDNKLVDLRNLLQEQKFGILATNLKGQPYGNLIAFVSTDDLSSMIIATDRNTVKYENLISEPRVSMVVTNAKNESSDLKQAISLTALGKAFEIKDQNALAKFEQIYLTKHPELENFIGNDSCALIKIDIKKIIMISNFQDKEIIEF